MIVWRIKKEDSQIQRANGIDAESEMASAAVSRLLAGDWRLATDDCLTIPEPMTLLDSLHIDADIAVLGPCPPRSTSIPTSPPRKRSDFFPHVASGRASRSGRPAGRLLHHPVVGEPLLIVCGSDNRLHGFFNVCRHRAGPPAEGCGSRKLFRCVYHGWTYNLDGSLNHATEIEGVEGFKPEDFALLPVRCEEWFNLVL